MADQVAFWGLVGSWIAALAAVGAIVATLLTARSAERIAKRAEVNELWLQYQDRYDACVTIFARLRGGDGAPPVAYSGLGGQDTRKLLIAANALLLVLDAAVANDDPRASEFAHILEVSYPETLRHGGVSEGILTADEARTIVSDVKAHRALERSAGRVIIKRHRPQLLRARRR